MGPLQDLATIALATVLRETPRLTSLYPTPDALIPWLTVRLNVDDGKASVLRRVCDQAWQAQELILSADTIDPAWKSAPAASPQHRIGELLTRLFDIFHLDDWTPRDERDACVVELERARKAGELERGSLDVDELARTVAHMVFCDVVTFRQEVARLTRSMADGFWKHDLPAIAALMIGLYRTDPPAVVRLAALLLHHEVTQNPSVFWGERKTTQDLDYLRERYVGFAITELQTVHKKWLEDWLNEVGSRQAKYQSIDDLRAEFEKPIEQGKQKREMSIDLSDMMELDQGTPFPPRPSIPTGPAPPPAPAPAAPPSTPAARPAAPPPPVTRAAPPPPPRPAAAPQAPARKMDQDFFTDKRISFGDHEDEDAAEAEPADSGPLKRRANVRWFKRMNPQRMYPLTVVLAKGRVREVKVKGVAQAVSAEQLVVTADNPFITVRPVLPGVKVYPPEQTVDVTAEMVSVRFHVLPQTLGEVPDARIEFYWRQRLISRIDLPMKVRKQTIAVVVSIAGILWPFLANAAKAMGADQDRSKDFAMQALGEFLRWPYAIEAGLAFLAVAAVLFYWINRPRESSEDTDVLSVKPMSLEELLSEGQRCLTQEHWDEARSYFEDAVNVAADSKPAKHGLQQAQQKRRFPLWETKE